ncbi:uncharacterized protein LAESUDRAFT_649649 [Laetiporus sulphureus 93-53]|uniref:Uncharacterized protein n=1 Tax=Laetiporus sulphureus 93-53 TaxID=1314785 RepID=A0A165F1R8_9APHY|nr:uncharacterized protein LAESUDRAFT_649649 [Laetiporus sulphureus 93-53]KZT08190.1 hypothetical protein LAESUDRAFT_649649 [Laetiporus sulphureus 93-53]
MLATLYHMFQPIAGDDPNQQSENDQEREENDSAVVLERPAQLDRKASSTLSLAMDRMRGTAPSRISWKAPSSLASPSSIRDPTWGTQYETHSASEPSLLLLNNATVHKTASVRRHSSQSLRTQSATGSETSEGQSAADPMHTRQLSALSDRVHFRVPTSRRPSVDSLPLTPDSARTHDGHAAIGLSAFPSAFINRPLKRTGSAASTSTFLSTVSAAPPPSIPPLDLRPNFQSTLSVAPRKSRLPAPTLPTVVGSPHPAKYSVIYEDNSSVRTSSFITAPSVHTPTPEPDLPHEVVAQDYAVSVVPSTEATPAVRTSGLPEGLYDADSNTQSRRSTPDNTQNGQLEPLLSPPAMPRPRSPSNDSESYIYNRWLRGVSFGSTRPVLERVKRDRLRFNLACVLFWVGFIGPWCWLIGGWLLSRDGLFTQDEQRAYPVLPMWVHKGKERADHADRDKVIVRKHTGVKLCYPLVAPSAEGLAPSVAGSVLSIGKFKPKNCTERRVDPWVLRCRYAAVTSGVLLLAACIVAVVVACTYS